MLRLLLLATLLGSAARATVVSGKITDLTGQPMTANRSVIFTLQNCGNNMPLVTGSSVVAPPSKTLAPNASGAITGTIIGNDILECGTTIGQTYYLVAIYAGTQKIYEHAFFISGPAWNITTAVPLSSDPTAFLNFSGYLLGDLIYGAGVNTLGLVRGNTSTSPKVLYQTGDGVHSSQPFWGDPATVTNSVLTTGSYSDPLWLTLTKAKVGLGNVENTALSTWTGSSNITVVGTLTAGTVPWWLLGSVPSTFPPAAHTHSWSNITSGVPGGATAWTLGSYLSYSGGNVGIGTTTPSEKLDVYGAIALASPVGGSRLRMGDVAGLANYQIRTNNSLGSPGAQDDATKPSWATVLGGAGDDEWGVFRRAPGGSSFTNYLDITSTGNVVIPYQSSTTNPHTSSTLQVGNSTTIFGTSDSAVNGQIFFPGRGRYHGYLTYYPSRADAAPYFRIAGQSATYGDSPMGLLVSGNVGIGTLLPGGPLTVSYAPSGQAQLHLVDASTSGAANSNVGLAGFGSNYSGNNSTTGRTWYIGNPGGSFWLQHFLVWNDRTSDTLFGTNGIERMRIKSTGNIGIGTTAPTAPLQVVGLATYASDAAAGSAGLTAGALYKDSAGGLHVKL